MGEIVLDSQLIMGKGIRLMTFIFVLFVLTSPWVYPFLIYQNYKNLSSKSPNPVDKEILIREINSLRTESVGVAPNFIYKPLVNKYTITFKHFLENYTSSFDPGFLFLQGTNNTTQYMQLNGPLYLAYLVLFIVGLFKILTIKRISLFLIGLLLLSPVPAALYGSPFDATMLIPLFLAITFFAAVGHTYLYKQKKRFFILLNLLLIFEVVRMYHNLFNHYLPYLSQQIK